ncbi:ribonuclease HII [uncultured Bifidobacterium sp.]|uniref:ribonuclease HII n=1 Tax=uncultured Bifidobacterium sp. TaxID=165187 RepID=UPI002638909B|nr:ribonuclease HII [uncultured Bifidobacterium sp.]
MSSREPSLVHEREMAARGFDLIIGCDEVGRGALAGPVMVGAAAMWAPDLREESIPDGLADSKLLTAKKREALVGPVRRWCADACVGSALNTEIDAWGMSHALGIAALRAVAAVESRVHGNTTAPPRIGVILDGPYDYITRALDSFDSPDVPCPFAVVTEVKADQHCALVSAASVVAKVTRDALMDDLSRSDPSYAPYRWESNKGYGSAAHRNAIARFGPTRWHRTSWHLV